MFYKLIYLIVEPFVFLAGVIYGFIQKKLKKMIWKSIFPYDN